MSRKRLVVSACVAGTVLAGSIAIAQQAGEHKPGAGQQMQLPPGWTEADMQACMAAGTPGKMHEHLTRDAGVWKGENTMWMAPGAEPIRSESTTTITPIMGGRFITCEVSGEMPGMGPFTGFGVYGYDNVAEQFVGTWVDNCGTGIMTGTGKLSSDGKTLTWTYTYNCPIRKKPVTMREVQTTTGPDSKRLDMYSTEPKSGEEYKMMTIELTRERTPAG